MASTTKATTKTVAWTVALAGVATASTACTVTAEGMDEATLALYEACTFYVEQPQEDGCGTIDPSQRREVMTKVRNQCVGFAQLAGARITPEWIRTCAQRPSQQHCERRAWAPLEECDAPEGELDVGQTCYADAQCASAFCDRGSEGSSCGQCARRIPLGSTCSIYPCVRGAACRDGVCVEDVDRRGERCGDGASYDCGPDSRCLDHRCFPRGEVGGRCSGPSDCLASLVCGTGGRCEPVLGPGASCSRQSACTHGYACSDAGTCDAISFVEDGEACDGELVRCHANATCAVSASGARRCTPDLVAGDLCSTYQPDAYCGDGLRCVAGSCTPIGPAMCR